MPIGRPPNEGDSETFKLTVPKPLYAYLLYLAGSTYAGVSVGEVVNHLLKLQLKELGAKLEVPPKPPVSG
jgi:hypothetical protein